MTKERIRYAKIGLVVAVAIMLVGVLIFRESSEAAMQAVSMFGLFTGLGIGMFLEDRDRKRKGEGPQ